MLVLHPLVCIEKELDILSQSMTVNRSQFTRDVKNIPVNLSRSTDISIKISPTPKLLKYVNTCDDKYKNIDIRRVNGNIELIPSDYN